MDFDPVAARLEGVKFMPPRNGRMLYDWILEQRPRAILEIGFAHGVSTCYMAAALDELGRGHITTIDHESSPHTDPSLSELLDDLGLASYVTPVVAKRSFSWELYRLLDADPRPTFDFVFHDADHTWDSTVEAFFLADKLLAPGGWMLFDDYKWTIQGSAGAMRSPRGKYPKEERTTPAVAEAFRLLVDEHPSYGSHVVSPRGGWGWTQKQAEAVPRPGLVRRSRVVPAVLGAAVGFLAGRSPAR